MFLVKNCLYVACLLGAAYCGLTCNIRAVIIGFYHRWMRSKHREALSVFRIFILDDKMLLGMLHDEADMGLF